MKPNMYTHEIDRCIEEVMYMLRVCRKGHREETALYEKKLASLRRLRDKSEQAPRYQRDLHYGTGTPTI